MLKITVPAAEFWDEIHEEFVYKKEQTLQLEHSFSLSFKMGKQMEQGISRKTRKKPMRKFLIMYDV